VSVRRRAASLNSGAARPRVPLYNTQRASIIEAAARYRVPAVYPFKYYVKEGGLLYNGIDQLDEWPHAAIMFIASSRARNLLICQCRRRPSTSL
jgi:hypothetical protein